MLLLTHNLQISISNTYSVQDMAQPQVQQQQGLAPQPGQPMQRPPQMMPPPQPDPVMQARIDADFRPVDLAVGGPGHAFAFCNKHKVEKCDECNVDFTALNRISKILVTNPNLRCPPPPTVVQQKLSQAVTNTKDEGNVRIESGIAYTVAHTVGRTSTNSINARKPLPSTILLQASQCNVHLGKAQQCFGRSCQPSSQIDRRPC